MVSSIKFPCEGGKGFLLPESDFLTPRVHARMSVIYQLSNSTKQSRRDIVPRLKSALELLPSQVPYLAATAAMDPELQRRAVETTGNNNGLSSSLSALIPCSTDLSSYGSWNMTTSLPGSSLMARRIPNP